MSRQHNRIFVAILVAFVGPAAALADSKDFSYWNPTTWWGSGKSTRSSGASYGSTITRPARTMWSRVSSGTKSAYDGTKRALNPWSDSAADPKSTGQTRIPSRPVNNKKTERSWWQKMWGEEEQVDKPLTVGDWLEKGKRPEF